MIDKGVSRKSKDNLCGCQLAKDAADDVQFNAGETSLIKEENCTTSTRLFFTD